MSKVATKDIAAALFAATKDADERQIKTAVKNTTALLHDANMLGKSEELIAKFEALHNRENGVIAAHVSVAHELSVAQKEQIESYILKEFGGETVELDISIAPELLGNIKIRVGDQVVNKSLDAQLRSLGEVLEG